MDIVTYAMAKKYTDNAISSSSDGGIDGVFIDTENVIQQSTSYSGSMTYTATQDCAVLIGWANKANDSVYVKIDGVNAISRYAGGITAGEDFLYLKKGQVLTVTNGYTDAATIYIVYGIQTGTTHSKFQPVIYSTEERVIGVWTDGKPLYEKTLIYSNIASLGNGAVFQTDLSNIDNGFVIGGKITEGTTEYVFPYVANNKSLGFKFEKSNNTFIAQGNDTFSNANLVIVIQYTKTTDTAGSGTWTPQGVPAHHYSTNEQIVGTWIDGSTLYEKTFEVGSISAGSDKEISHNILNFEHLISVEGYGVETNAWVPIPFVDNIDSYQRYFRITSSIITIGAGNNSVALSDCYVTIRYTKSS